MKSEMTTTRIDTDSLQKLRMLAERSSRSAPNYLALLIEDAFRKSPSALSDLEFLGDMMNSIVENVEAGIPTDAALENARQFSAAGRISWGEENGVVVGAMADGTRCDTNGNVLRSPVTR